MQTEVREFEATTNYAEMAGEMSFSAFKDMGYDTVLLVEGVTDVKTIQQLLRKYNKDHKMVIIPLGGDQLARGDVEVELAELKRLSNSVAAIVDSERTSATADPKRERKEFATICAKLGIRICLTDRRALENYLADRAVKHVLGNRAKAVAPYEQLSAAAVPWNKKISWRIARAMDLSDIQQTDVGVFLASV